MFTQSRNDAKEEALFETADGRLSRLTKETGFSDFEKIYFTVSQSEILAL
jgi:hypothetical protein